MAVLVKNNAYSTLASGINSTDTSITLAAGTGSRFPAAGGADYFYATLIDTSNNLEVVKVTSRSTDTLTVVRGQDGTTARAYSSSSRIELRVTAALIADIRDSIAPGDGTVTSAKIVDGAVINSKLANDAVTAAKIADSSVITAKIADNSVTGTKIALGSDAQGDVMFYNGTDWARLAAGETGQVLKTSGSGANPLWSSSPVFMTAYTIPGITTIYTVTGIPSWARRITVLLSNMDFSGSLGLQLGDSGGVEDVGYSGSVSYGGGSATTWYSSYFILTNQVGGLHSGVATLLNISGNTWVISGTFHDNSSTAPCFFGGSKTLSATLDRVRIMTSGASTLSAGTVNVVYE